MEILEGGKRYPTIKKNVLYLDFRTELSAFDKYFYFDKLNESKNIKSKQDLLRKNSNYLINAINSGRIYRR